MALSADCHRGVTGGGPFVPVRLPPYRTPAALLPVPVRAVTDPGGDSALPVSQNGPVPFLLLIEDDDAIRTGLELALTRQGHRVATAASGEDGLRLFKEQRPDLIVLDVMLPGIDGFEVCRRIRRTDQLPIICSPRAPTTSTWSWAWSPAPTTTW